jgi:hypothetical protein
MTVLHPKRIRASGAYPLINPPDVAGHGVVGETRGGGSTFQVQSDAPNPSSRIGGPGGVPAAFDGSFRTVLPVKSHNLHGYRLARLDAGPFASPGQPQDQDEPAGARDVQIHGAAWAAPSEDRTKTR